MPALMESIAMARAEQSGKVMAPHTSDRLATLPDQDLSDLSPAVRKEILTLAGKETASRLGGTVLLEMLGSAGKSLRQLSRESGFDVGVLSRIARGKTASGPDLWTLVALADAMGFDLQVSFTKR